MFGRARKTFVPSCRIFRAPPAHAARLEKTSTNHLFSAIKKPRPKQGAAIKWVQGVDLNH